LFGATEKPEWHHIAQRHGDELDPMESFASGGPAKRVSLATARPSHNSAIDKAELGS